MKIYERIVKSTFEPNRNDLWLKPGEGGSITMYEYNGGEWLPIGAAGGSGGGSGSGGSSLRGFLETYASGLDYYFKQKDSISLPDTSEAYFIPKEEIDPDVFYLIVHGAVPAVRVFVSRGKTGSNYAFAPVHYSYYSKEETDFVGQYSEVLEDSGCLLVADDTGFALSIDYGLGANSGGLLFISTIS